MNSLSRIYWIGKGVGWDNVPRRLLQSFRLRSGFLKKAMVPAHYKESLCELNTISPEARIKQWHERVACFFTPPSPRRLQEIVSPNLWNEQVVQPLEDALSGNYPMFSHWTSPLGWPPNFNRDASNNIDWPTGKCWLETAKSGPPRNDIKLVWEPSRLTLVYTLARAYQYDCNERWAKSFWELIEAWIAQNPVNESVAWGCGQEVAFRLMAFLFGTRIFLRSSETTPDRLRKIDLLAWQSGKRIESNINYAISQENNHALSEATGLWTLGLLYSELPEAKRWRSRGKRILESEIRRQIYVDGSYVQHSMSYHRVMLDDMLWAIALGTANGKTFSSECLDLVRRSVQWLDQFVDSENGRVPNLGANDGANVLPLSCSDYLDYRPVLDSLGTILQIPIKSCELGIWNEKKLWFSSTSEAPTPSRETNPIEQQWTAPVGGYHIVRNQRGYALLRAGNYSDRPGQCDMLHLDLWVNHINILRDSGSFHYYHSDRQLKDYFYSVAAHNTLQPGDSNQMTKGPNFLWFHWPKVTVRSLAKNVIVAEATFKGEVQYSHSRVVTLTEESLIVQDVVQPHKRQKKPNILRWHLAPELSWSKVDNNNAVGHLDGTPYIKIYVVAQTCGQVNITTRPESLYYGKTQETQVLEFESSDLKFETLFTFI